MKSYLFSTTVLLMIGACAALTATAQTGKVYAWARIYTATKDSRHPGVTESSFYTSIDRIEAVNAPQAKQNVTSYFNQKIVPYFEGDPKLTLKDVQVKTFTTLEEADDARYASFKKDKDALNPRDDSGLFSTFFFNCSLSDNSAPGSWMSDVEEVQVDRSPRWRFFAAETRLQRISNQSFVEQRFYFSEPFEVYVVGSDTRRWHDIFNTYFGAIVDEPFQKQLGIEIQWSRDAVEIMPGYIRNDVGNTYRETKQTFDELIDNRVGFDRPMLMFRFAERGAGGGEAMGQVRCFKNCERAKAPLITSPANTKNAKD